jgi:hypothetical protein
MTTAAIKFPPVGEKFATDQDPVTGAHTMKVAGNVTTTPGPEVAPTTHVPTVVAANNADTSLLAADATRTRAVIVNNVTSATLYVAYGRAASTVVWDEILFAGDRLQTDWQGTIRGYWATATGDAHVSAFKA